MAEQAPEQSAKDEQSVTPDILNAQAAVLEKENEAKKRLLDAQENAKILGGKSEAGSAPAEKPVETPREYSKRILTGRL